MPMYIIFINFLCSLYLGSIYSLIQFLHSLSLYFRSQGLASTNSGNIQLALTYSISALPACLSSKSFVSPCKLAHFGLCPAHSGCVLMDANPCVWLWHLVWSLVQQEWAGDAVLMVCPRMQSPVPASVSPLVRTPGGNRNRAWPPLAPTEQQSLAPASVSPLARTPA